MKWLCPSLALGLLLSGCLPEERIWWAPDGEHAIVIVDKALYSVTAGAALGSPLDPQKTAIPQAVCWLRGGDGIVLYRQVPFATWKEISPLLPASEARRIELLALAVPTLLEGSLKLSSGGTEPGDLIASAIPCSPEDFLIALRCAWQDHNQSVAKSLTKLPGGEELLKKLTDETFLLNELCLLKFGKDLKPLTSQPLARSLYEMAEPKISPAGDFVAWLQAGPKAESISLTISSLDGGSRLTVCEAATTAFGWTPDGQSIVFAAPLAGQKDSMALLRMSAVVGKSGKLLVPSPSGEQADRVPLQTDLGIALMPDPAHLQILPDGRILFSSRAASAPAFPPPPDAELKFYLAAADGSKMEALQVAAGVLPSDLSFFTASPDGKSAAVVGSGNDAVIWVNLESGATEVISPANPGWLCRTMPAWRNSDELTFAGISDGIPRWMMWSKAGGVQPIGSKWPVAATADWLKEDKKSE